MLNGKDWREYTPKRKGVFKQNIFISYEAIVKTGCGALHSGRTESKLIFYRRSRSMMQLPGHEPFIPLPRVPCYHLHHSAFASYKLYEIFFSCIKSSSLSSNLSCLWISYQAVSYSKHPIFVYGGTEIQTWMNLQSKLHYLPKPFLLAKYTSEEGGAKKGKLEPVNYGCLEVIRYFKGPMTFFCVVIRQIDFWKGLQRKETGFLHDCFRFPF